MPKTEKEAARHRIQRLFDLAEDAESLDRATQYVERAREVAERNRVQIPGELRSRYCRSCGRYLRPGDNARVRLQSDRGHVSVRCLDCGASQRHPYRDDGEEDDP